MKAKTIRTVGENNKAALRALIDLAGGYCATPEQILQIASQYDIEPWQLEGFYFDEMECAGDE